MDRISNLPDNLIELILEKLPVIDRVKTSALSISWGYRWTYLTALVLDSRFYFSNPRFTEIRAPDHTEVVSSLVSQHCGGLKELYWYVPIELDCPVYCLEFERTIRHTVEGNKGLERLLLRGPYRRCCLRLTKSIFRAVNLKHLEISCIRLLPPSEFQGFPNLTRFVLGRTIGGANAISRFVSVCPQLEEVGLEDVSFYGQNLHFKAPKLAHFWVDGKYINIYLSNAPNMESISMSLHSPPQLQVVSSISADMFGYFTDCCSRLQKVSLNGCFCQLLGNCTSIIQMLPRFNQVTRLEFTDLNLNDLDELRCVLNFCACSPNVRELFLLTHNLLTAPTNPSELESMAKWYIKEDLGKLVRVNLLGIEGLKIEIKIIEILLRFSPVLEVMCIDFHPFAAEDERALLLKATVINFYRASTEAKIYFTI